MVLLDALFEKEGTPDCLRPVCVVGEMGRGEMGAMGLVQGTSAGVFPCGLTFFVISRVVVPEWEWCAGCGE